ncbi:MAG: Bax inhibitor-1/YccA family protein [Candidatus Omnitrophica bacterium]|nr:Bax inhibitor-1/YccA family protein [Candidatus Omnitrophota bacterium]MDE2009790.1 Bax inhibitor-1/YccA family protein [Candidatus Omnitrophota bacterium]MDE2215135.1 Bax inhibitor-1/YccA family protein [Candidatus Omnitrophota bacterium]MDE2231489.1 Bax inhibitor-1/YccA family protein [Candidatus Omnitrophota bacterium]
MQSSNPTLNERTFGAARVGVGEPTMTIQGTVNKTLILLAILIAGAMWTWSQASNPASAGMLGIVFFVSMIGGFILAIATSFKPTWSPVTAPIYAACEGLLLGVLSAYFEARYPGIVMQAVGLTFAVAFAMLMGYKSGWLQATPALRKGLMIAMGGLMIFYVVVWIASMFGIHPPGFINGGGPLGIAFSLFVVGIASMSLILDFDMIESAAREGVAQYMEWYGAFALMVTLIWLYMEILRLLSKINRRD